MAKNDLPGRMKARSMVKACGYAMGGSVQPMPPGPKALNSVQKAVSPSRPKKKRQPGPAAAPAGPSLQGLGAGGYKRGGKVKK